MAQRRSTAEQVYAWAVENDIPAPDAFAVRYWDLAGATVRLALARRIWRRQVERGTTGFPLVDGAGSDS